MEKTQEGEGRIEVNGTIWIIKNRIDIINWNFGDQPLFAKLLSNTYSFKFIENK